MVADQPLVVYPKKDKAPTKQKMDDAYARWKARKEKEQGDALVGKKVSLADFLK